MTKDDLTTLPALEAFADACGFDLGAVAQSAIGCPVDLERLTPAALALVADEAWRAAEDLAAEHEEERVERALARMGY